MWISSEDGTRDVDGGSMAGQAAPRGRWRPAGCVQAILSLFPPALQVQGAMQWAEDDQVRMARDLATMFDELKTLADRHAALHAD